MSLIPTPATIEDAPAAAQGALRQVEKAVGFVPNLYRLTATSPAALNGMLGLSGALSQGALDAPTRERIALAIANVNGCTYCNSAHTLLGRGQGLSEAEIAANRAGGSTDPGVDAAIAFARDVAVHRAVVDAEDVQRVRDAGYSDAQIVEIVAHVALNTFTNYVNEVFGTEVDFPEVLPAARAA